MENAVFESVVDFLRSPEGFESEMQRRRGLTVGTVESLRKEVDTLKRKQQEERNAEAQAFRLATRTKVNEDVFDQEVGLIHTRQRWIKEEIERVQVQIKDLELYTFSSEALALLRQRLEARLASPTPEDIQYILEAVGARVVVQTDGSWELELQVPRQPAEQVKGFQIVNNQPGLNSSLIHI
jgi:hypothetical protein